jgi:hypothetical protein
MTLEVNKCVVYFLQIVKVFILLPLGTVQKVCNTNKGGRGLLGLRIMSEHKR